MKKRLLGLSAAAEGLHLPLSLSVLLLCSDDLLAAHRSSSGRTVSAQEGLDRERTGELRLTSDPSDGFAGRITSKVQMWRLARARSSHFRVQLWKKLQESIEVATHHLHCDLTAVQFPAGPPPAVLGVWILWDLTSQSRSLKTRRLKMS